MYLLSEPAALHAHLTEGGLGMYLLGRWCHVWGGGGRGGNHLAEKRRVCSQTLSLPRAHASDPCRWVVAELAPW